MDAKYNDNRVETKVVDPDGDLLLFVGTDQKLNMLVSSKTLSLASPVFKAMFSQKFKEGKELATR
jgi:hypothetical protein